MSRESIDAIQEWYASCCNGDWEHSHGVQIGTLDNPGWSVDIDVSETSLEARPFIQIKIERSQSDWLNCQVCFGVFQGRGGPKNLVEMLEIFRNWAA